MVPRAVIFSYGGFVCCFEAAKCPLDRSKAFSCYQIGMGRHRSIRQVVNLVLDFLNERAAHCPWLRSYALIGTDVQTTSARTTCSLVIGKHCYGDNCMPKRPTAGNFIAGLRTSIPITPPRRFSSIPSTQPIL